MTSCDRFLFYDLSSFKNIQVVQAELHISLVPFSACALKTILPAASKFYRHFMGMYLYIIIIFDVTAEYMNAG